MKKLRVYTTKLTQVVSARQGFKPRHPGVKHVLRHLRSTRTGRVSPQLSGQRAAGEAPCSCDLTPVYPPSPGEILRLVTLQWPQSLALLPRVYLHKCCAPGKASEGPPTPRRGQETEDDVRRLGSTRNGLPHLRRCFAVPGPLFDLRELVDQKDALSLGFATRFHDPGAGGAFPELLHEQVVVGGQHVGDGDEV